MLFRKDIEPRCMYCSRASRLNEQQVVCRKRGVVNACAHCDAFRYDPLKRVPPRPTSLDTEKLSEEDFSL